MDEKELAAELFEGREDSDEWGDPEPDSPTTTTQRQPLRAMVSIRLTGSELERIQVRAQENNQTVSAYLRALALRDVAGGLNMAAITYDVSATSADFFSGRITAPMYVSDGRSLCTTSAYVLAEPAVA